MSREPPTLLTAVSLLSRDDSWSSLYSPDVNRTENTASNSSSVVAYMPVVATEPLPRNGRLCGAVPIRKRNLLMLFRNHLKQF
jgi:hypothetical protein